MPTCCIQVVGIRIDTCVCVFYRLFFLFSAHTAAPGDPLIHGLVKLGYFDCTRGFIWRLFRLSLHCLHYSAPDPVELETAK